MPQKTWVVGEEVLAADFNTFVQQQTVGTFANAAARTAAISAPPEGMLTYLADVDRYETWNGATWKQVYGGVPIGGGQSALAGTYTGQPVQLRGWKQTMGTDGSGNFASGFPSPVNGVLSASVQFIGAAAISCNLTGATVNSISGNAYNTNTATAVANQSHPFAFIALVW